MKYKEEVLQTHGTRMHRKQKKAFRNFVSEESKKMGYDCKIEQSAFANNIVVGDPEKADVILTAHYDTPPRLPKFFVKNMLFHSFFTLPALMVAMMALPYTAISLGWTGLAATLSTVVPIATYVGCGALFAYLFGFLGGANKKNFNDNSSGCLTLLNIMDKYKNLNAEQKQKVAFVFTDNEEKGLLGSMAFKHKHRKTYKTKTFINFDCVGMGKNVNLFHFGKPTQITKELNGIISNSSEFSSTVQKSSMTSLSDHYPVRKANHVCLLNTDVHNKGSLYEEIHSTNDKRIEYSNIDNLVKLVTKANVFKPLEEEYQSQMLTQSAETVNINTQAPKKYKKKKSIEYIPPQTKDKDIELQL